MKHLPDSYYKAERRLGLLLLFIGFNVIGLGIVVVQLLTGHLSITQAAVSGLGVLVCYAVIRLFIYILD